MNRHFYPKLAAGNLKKNSRVYLPYIISCVFTVAMFYIINMLSTTRFFGHLSLGQMLSLGVYVIGIFSVIFLFYTNSFLIKRRKMEFGLFNVLGMGKRHIAKVILLETLYTAVISFVLGLGLGILLSKLVFLILQNLINFKLQDSITVSVNSIVTTLILFAAIFLLTLLNSLRLIHLAKPIELLKGGQKGEREPKTKWVLTLLGTATLAAGYYMAITIDNPLKALTYFFFAVILVIIGTYCLFTAVSIFFLKLLKKNKTYYYKTNHFISVSGMMYRIKQNAVGLANICILATIVLVTISTTISLYTGVNDVLAKKYPNDISIGVSYDAPGNEKINSVVDKAFSKSGYKIASKGETLYYSQVANEAPQGFELTDIEDLTVDYPKYEIISVTAEDYNKATGNSTSLSDNEVTVLTKKEKYEKDEINLGGSTFKVASSKVMVQDESAKMLSFDPNAYISECVYVVFPNEKNLIDFHESVKSKIDNIRVEDMVKKYRFDIEDVNGESISDEQVTAIGKDLPQLLLDEMNVTPGTEMKLYTEIRAGELRNFLEIYGGLLFLGIYLGVLFLMATVLIIYYKQLSEGYEDQNRFKIMQNVGLTKKEVRKAIRSQVLTMFFMPLIVACIHISCAFPMISKLLLLFNMDNTHLFLLCTLGAAAVFAVFYVLVYVLTSRMYYRIVEAT